MHPSSVNCVRLASARREPHVRSQFCSYHSLAEVIDSGGAVMSQMDELTWLDATDQARLVSRREIKPVELVEAAIGGLQFAG